MEVLRFLKVIFLGGVVLGCEGEVVAPRGVVVSEDGAMELCVMTFNVRYENESETGRRAWSERLVGIVKMLREEAPDVFGTQEGQHGQMADLWASLPDYEFAGWGRDDGKKRGEYAGIYFRRDRFEKDEGRSGMVWLSDTPGVAGSRGWGNSYPRVATWVRLIDRMSGRGVWVINVHLDHRNQASRERGVRLMAERLVGMNPEGEAVVWLGDFNATEGNEVVKFLQGRGSSIRGVDGFEGLRETFDALHAGVRRRGTLHFWMSDASRQWKVDHIFVSKGAEVLESGIVRGGEPYLSDHFPVMARVRWGGGE